MFSFPRTNFSYTALEIKMAAPRLKQTPTANLQIIYLTTGIAHTLQANYLSFFNLIFYF